MLNILRIFLGHIDSYLEKIIKVLLVVAVMSMLSISVYSIVLRWLQSSLPWTDPLVRHLVFLTTFLGGILATGRGSHISIDLLLKRFESKGDEKKLRYLKVLTSAVSIVVLVWLGIATWEFFKMEMEFGRTVFFGLKTGHLSSIIPVGMFLLAFRFFYQFIESLDALSCTDQIIITKKEE